VPSCATEDAVTPDASIIVLIYLPILTLDPPIAACPSRRDLDKICEAHRTLEDGHVSGKLVVRPR
jgi:hypothetical protein